MGVGWAPFDIQYFAFEIEVDLLRFGLAIERAQDLQVLAPGVAGLFGDDQAEGRQFLLADAGQADGQHA